MKSVLDMGCGDGQLLEAPGFFQVMNFKQPMDLDGSEIRQIHQKILYRYIRCSIIYSDFAPSQPWLIWYILYFIIYRDLQ